MMKYFLSFFLAVSTLNAGWVFTNGKLKNEAYLPSMSAEEHFIAGGESFDRQEWEEALRHFSIVADNFPGSLHGNESSFFLGVCYYELDELDFANSAFTEYLKSSQPKYFQETMEYKFCIANEFRAGACRRPFGTKQLPKWLPSRKLAYTIYEEVIQAIPCHEFAARSLWFKGSMLREDCLYQDSIDAFQTLIRRFPKHTLTPKAYLAINQVFLEEAEWEFQNPDLLQLAEINVRKFEQAFPRDEKVEEAKQSVQTLKETYAGGLWKTGQFYEWQGYKEAAKIYYESAIKQFPDTGIAEKCKNRLFALPQNP